MSKSKTETNSKKTTFKVLPEGEYVMGLKKYEIVDTKNGKGKMLKATFEVLKPNKGDKEVVGKAVWHNFMLEHSESEKAVFVGRKQLEAYLKAVGVENGMEGINDDITELDNLLNDAFIGVVTTEEYERDGKSGTSNKIKYFNAK